MTPAPPGPPPRDLPARLFRALYPAYDLRTIGGTHIVTPAGTPVLASESLGHIARQISTSHQQPPAAGPGTGPDRAP